MGWRADKAREDDERDAWQARLGALPSAKGLGACCCSDPCRGDDRRVGYGSIVFSAQMMTGPRFLSGDPRNRPPSDTRNCPSRNEQRGRIFGISGVKAPWNLVTAKTGREIKGLVTALSFSRFPASALMADEIIAAEHGLQSGPNHGRPIFLHRTGPPSNRAPRRL